MLEDPVSTSVALTGADVGARTDDEDAKADEATKRVPEPTLSRLLLRDATGVTA